MLNKVDLILYLSLFESFSQYIFHDTFFPFDFRVKMTSSNLSDGIPLVSNRGFVHLQSVQLLHAAPADGYGGVGEADGSSLRSAGAAGRRQPLLAGDGGAAARTVTHGLSHTHLTERQLVCELMVLLENRGKCLMKPSGLCALMEKCM